MKIANIVSASKLNLSTDFNIVNSMDDVIHGIPTLIIGFDIVNKLYPDFDITERQVEPNLYWIFKKTERRDDFEVGLKWFREKVLKDLFKDISYVFVDLMQYNKKTLFKIARKIIKLDKKISFSYNNMIYIYGEKIIFGVDLTLFKFVGINTDKLKNLIQSKSTVFLGVNDILIEDKNIINELGDQIRYLPYLLAIRNEQNTTFSGLHIS